MENRTLPLLSIDTKKPLQHLDLHIRNELPQYYEEILASNRDICKKAQGMCFIQQPQHKVHSVFTDL